MTHCTQKRTCIIRAFVPVCACVCFGMGWGGGGGVITAIDCKLRALWTLSLFFSPNGAGLIGNPGRCSFPKPSISQDIQGGFECHTSFHLCAVTPKADSVLFSRNISDTEQLFYDRNIVFYLHRTLIGVTISITAAWQYTDGVSLPCSVSGDAGAASSGKVRHMLCNMSHYTHTHFSL